MVQVNTERLRDNIAARRAAAVGLLDGFKARSAARDLVAAPAAEMPDTVSFANPSREKLNQILAAIRDPEAVRQRGLAFNSQPQLAMSFDQPPHTPAAPPRPRTVVPG